MTRVARAYATRLPRASGRAGIAVGILALACACALKRACSSAGADALGWLLAPSCWLAGHAGGLRLVREPGAGFISHAPRMVVGPPCAGVTFLVVAWLAFYFCAQASFAGTRRKLAWLCASALAAYLATLATNGLRIALAAQLYDADIYAGLLTRARLHRALGVVLYCSTLFASCGLIQRCTCASTSSPRAKVAPLLWYLGVVLLLPFAHGAWLQHPGAFAEHALLTPSLACAVAVLGWLYRGARNRLSSARVPD